MIDPAFLARWQHGILFCTGLTGPGDPRYSGPPTQRTADWIRGHTQTDSRGRRQWNDHGTLRRLESAADFAALNRALDGIRRPTVL